MNIKIKQTIIICILFILSGCNNSDKHKDVIVKEDFTIIDALKKEGEYDTLLSLLESAELKTTLSDQSAEFTLFAPTDSAFAHLGEQTLEKLKADKDKLKSILTYHVLSTKVDSSGAVASAGNTVETVNGAKLALSLDTDENLLVNTDLVTKVDINADNGIIHQLDGVIIPPELPSQEPTKNIVETAITAGTFTTLVTALEATDLDDVLADASKEFTVFAPTDNAFSAIGSTLLNELLNKPEVLADILKQHVIASKVDSVTAMSLNNKEAETVLGNKLGVHINRFTDSLLFAGAKISVKDVYASNGVIHVIDTVILDKVTLPESESTITAIASGSDTFDTLVAALSATDLDSVLSDKTKKFTVFAPTDAAFDALGQDTINALLADTDKLKDILLYHVLPDARVLSDGAADVANKNHSTITMANQDNSALSLTQSQLFINDSAISSANIIANNGVIHVIDKVILPPSDDTTSDKTIAEIATATDSLTTLVAALQAAELVDTFNDKEKTFTVFAPTNNAFKKIPKETLDALLADKEGLTKVLTQHVLASKVASIDAYAANGSKVVTLANNKLTATLVNFAGTTNKDSDSVAYDALNQRLVAGKGDNKKGLTLYTFDNDLEQSMSMCDDSCATNWPPVIGTEESIKNIPGLSLIKRADESMQVAYLGRPLYTYINDENFGDAKGEGVGGVWFQVGLPSSSLQIAGSNITVTDIYANNGVIHIIDTVITSVK